MDYKQYPPKPEQTGSSVGKLGSLIGTLGMLVVFFLITGGSMDAMIAVVIVLMIHELGHLTMMKLFGFSDGDMFFLPFMHKAATGKSIPNQRKRVITLLAGPLPGVMAGIGLLSYGFAIEHQLLLFFGQAFLLVNVFNLLPFDPMDGGKLVDTLFASKKDQIKLSFLVVALLAIAALSFYIPTLIVFGVFIGIRINSILKKRKLRLQLVTELNVDINKRFEDVSDKEYWEIRRFVLKQIPNIPIDPDRFEPFANENLLISQVKSLILNPVKVEMSTLGKLVSFVLWLAGLAVPIWYVWVHFQNLPQ